MLRPIAASSFGAAGVEDSMAIADRLAYAEWEKRGSRTAEERACERWSQLLATHQAPPLDPAAEREILRLIAARERATAATQG